jgi:hypothetical protein
MKPKKVIVTNKDGDFECAEEGATGMCIVGRGASVTEAVGMWAIYSRLLEVRCDPPEVLQEFRVNMNYSDLSFSPPPKRS